MKLNLKKTFGQHFLNNVKIAENIIASAKPLINSHRVLEIGPGGGFLTKQILQSRCKELLAVEIDQEWADQLGKNITDKRLKIFVDDFVQFPLDKLDLGVSTCATNPSQPCNGAIILANLPYNATFAILFKIKKHLENFCFGTLMIQEEVAQRLVATSGKSMGSSTIALNHKIEFKLLEKIGPENFNPPPKVFSRLIKFSPRSNPIKIDDEEKFMNFLRLIFGSPGKTIKNNLKGSWNLELLDQEVLKKRARQCNINELNLIWESLSRSKSKN